jgi:hypothetical protein
MTDRGRRSQHPYIYYLGVDWMLIVYSHLVALRAREEPPNVIGTRRLDCSHGWPGRGYPGVEPQPSPTNAFELIQAKAC